MQEIQECPCGATANRSAERRQPPSYMSYWSYSSYRVVLWHVADVPGVQGQLEAWMLGSLVSLHNDCFVARLPRALFSVFCGRGRFGPLGLHALFSGAR